MTGPLLRLANLSHEEFYELLRKIRHVYAFGEPSRYLLPDEALVAFMEHCHNKIGEAYFRTPRTTITAFINLLAVLEQNPSANWKELLCQVVVENKPEESAPVGAAEAGDDTDELTKFKL